MSDSPSPRTAGQDSGQAHPGQAHPGQAHPAGTLETRRALFQSLRQEFEAPVDAIVHYASMLREDAAKLSDPSFASDLERIETGGRSLLAMIDELLVLDGASALAELDDEAFASRVRHDLRTPLNHIIGYSELLLEEAPEVEEAGGLVPDLERVLGAARKLLARIDDLLTLSRTEEGREAALGDRTAHVLIRDMAAALAPGSGRPRGAGQIPSRILVVDDNEDNRTVLVRRLERQGHAPTEAVDGEQALALLARGSFDLVLLDMLMPRMNGYEALARMKEDEALRAIPVIMITALDETVSVVRCLELGAEDYLTKPFNPTVLDARIGASLEKKHFRDREVDYLRQIEEEKQRTESLLRVILPEEIAEELKANGEVPPRRYPKVAVLFTDVVGFTSYCDTHGAEDMVGALQQLVEGFEAIAERHGLEKIKTIGDAFMATAGLLAPVDNPALRCVRSGLDMVAESRQLAGGWEVRVGVHVGDVVGGIVGHKKYQFDIWGDTVNTASRMESHGVPGGVNLSRDAWEQVRRHCHGHSRGTLPIKGKGEMEMFQVEGLRQSS